MLNELSVLPLYLACQSLVPQNSSDNGSVFGKKILELILIEKHLITIISINYRNDGKIS